MFVGELIGVSVNDIIDSNGERVEFSFPVEKFLRVEIGGSAAGINDGIGCDGEEAKSNWGKMNDLRVGVCTLGPRRSILYFPMSLRSLIGGKTMPAAL